MIKPRQKILSKKIGKLRVMLSKSFYLFDYTYYQQHHYPGYQYLHKDTVYFYTQINQQAKDTYTKHR